ncbi:MAG: TolC family protein [Isosphaeraceae bacterium]
MERIVRTGNLHRQGRGSLRWLRLAAPPLWIATAVAGCSPSGAIRWGPPGSTPPRPMATMPLTARSPGAPRSDEYLATGALPEKPDASLVKTSADEPPDRLPPAIPPGPERPTPPATAPRHAAVEGVVAPAVPPADHGEFPIDLTTALRLAEAENPVIAEARVRISEALAVQQQARALLLPSLNAGVNYHGHVGNLQRSSGRILNLSEQSLYFGGGAGATAAGSIGLAASQARDIRFPVSFLANDAPGSVPAVNIYSELAEAIYQPLAARQAVAGARFAAAATANHVLLEVAELHFELTAAIAELEARRETARQESEVARLTRAYAEAKQGRQSDAERALTELRLINREVLQAEEAVAVTSTRLVRRLHLDPTVRLRPASPALEPVTLVDPGLPLPELLRIALHARPEVGATQANVSRAEIRHRQEVHRPLLPTVFLGFSSGGFGGGSNLAPPTIGNFAGRSDFDVGVFWTAENLGFGNLAHMKRRRAELGEAVAERSRTLAEVRTEVSEALAGVLASRPQLEITSGQLRSAEAGFSEDLTRIRNVVGRPIEVVNSLQLLNDARVGRIRAVTEYNMCQVRLFVALGSPPPLDPAAEPAEAPPVAWPPVSPIPVPPHHGH